MASDNAESKYLFLVLCFIGAFAILSSTMSKNPVLNPFAESLGTPEALMGFVAAASTLPGVIISLPVGSLSDIIGRKKVLLASMIVFASAPFFYVLVNSWWQLVLVRFYHGFATAIFVPVARATITEIYTSRKGEKISTFTSATIVGRGIAPFLGGFILSFTYWNYQMLYLAVGASGIISLLTTLVAFKGSSMKERGSLDAGNHHRERRTDSSKGWMSVLSNAGVLVASTTEAAARYVYGALEFFFVGYMKNVALLDPSLIGTIMGMQLILIPIVNPFMGRLSDRLGRKIIIVAGLIVSGLPLLAVPYTTQFLSFLVISTAFGLGFSMIISSTPALVGDLVGRGSYGTAMGFLATIMDVGQMLGPIATGFILAAFGYSGSFLSLGAILLAVCVFFSVYQKLAS